ncbi:AraC family transcriptional regulator [Flagellimonas sp. CMM7]|uniref:helix-turn-helix domain-containing protein n=1 Tax=Flagellimonas sp. CMM7 TaxID=2654676 RepID=UPI0013D60F31|nr:response regulator transcription factor [Flagellimonas sp. CMM7]UII78604.1 helix-turn-helix transcriptional regulator [Flagellimonas sp. CMM7]
MEFSYNIISLIDILGVVQGLLFGIMLLFMHSKKNKPTLFLGLFILLFSLEPIPNVLEDMGVLLQYPILELPPIHFHFLAYPLFYIYIQKISVFNEKKLSYWTLIPGVVETIGGLIIFLLPIATKLQLKESSFALVYFVLGLCYSIFIGILTIRWIMLHQKEVDNQFSETVHKNLNWSKLFVFGSIFFQILFLIHLFIDNHTLYFFVTLVNVILIYWVSFKGITQENIVSLYLFFHNKIGGYHNAESENKTIEISNPPLELPAVEKVKTPFMTAEEMKEVIEMVTRKIKRNESFLKSNLTIVDIAEETNIHPKRISHALNNQLGVNFNGFINKFRVNKAKALLVDEKSKNLSIEGIGMEVGFNTKATFYAAFKKYEGCTPAKYRS